MQPPERLLRHRAVKAAATERTSAPCALAGPRCRRFSSRPGGRVPSTRPNSLTRSTSRRGGSRGPKGLTTTTRRLARTRRMRRTRVRTTLRRLTTRRTTTRMSPATGPSRESRPSRTRSTTRLRRPCSARSWPTAPSPARPRRQPRRPLLPLRPPRPRPRPPQQSQLHARGHTPGALRSGDCWRRPPWSPSSTWCLRSRPSMTWFSFGPTVDWAPKSFCWRRSPWSGSASVWRRHSLWKSIPSHSCLDTRCSDTPAAAVDGTGGLGTPSHPNPRTPPPVPHHLHRATRTEPRNPHRTTCTTPPAPFPPHTAPRTAASLFEGLK